MSFRPGLVALDVDGTMVDESNVLTAPVRDALMRVVDAGVPLVLATGRSWASAVTVLDQLPAWRAEHVCSNGAVTVHYPPFAVGEVLTFDPAPVIDRIRVEVPDALFAVEALGRGYNVTSAFPDGELHGRTEIVTLDAMRAAPATRIIVRDPAASEDEFLDLAGRLGLVGVSYSVGYCAWLDIAPPGVDKAHGLQRVCERLGVARSEVLALGDGRNDIEMLAWAGRGVAMGGSPDVLLDVADDVTGHLDEGGLIDELDRWFRRAA